MRAALPTLRPVLRLAKLHFSCPEKQTKPKADTLSLDTSPLYLLCLLRQRVFVENRFKWILKRMIFKKEVDKQKKSQLSPLHVIELNKRDFTQPVIGF